MSPSTANDRVLPELPTELTDVIIDHLHNDKLSLRNCALVSNAWLNSSRYHLFYAIRVRGELPRRSFTDFVIFIGSTPRIRDHIRELTFRINGGLASQPPAIRCVGPYIFASVLKSLPMLRAISLNNISWDRNLITGPDERAVQVWPPVPRALDTLTLSRVVTEEFLTQRIFRLNDLVELFFAFSPLRTMRALGMTLELNSQDPALQVLPEKLHLRELQLHSNYARIPLTPVLDAIHSKMAKHLRKLSAVVRNDGEASVLGNILRGIGSTLEELRLDHSDLTVLRAFNAPGPWHTYNLPALTALRSLDLEVWSSGAHVTGDLFTYEGQWCLCSVAPLLSYLAPALRTLRIVLHISGYRAQLRAHLGDSVDWAGLLRQLERFARLQRIELEIRPRRGQHVLPDALDAVQDIVERRLAPLVQSGLMVVDVVEDVAPPPARGER